MSTSVTYGVEFTIKTAQFENVKPSFSMTEDVRDGEHPSDTAARVVALVDSWLTDKVEEINEDLRAVKQSANR